MCTISTPTCALISEKDCPVPIVGTASSRNIGAKILAMDLINFIAAVQELYFTKAKIYKWFKSFGTGRVFAKIC